MGLLRRRFLVATGMLLALQVGSTVAALTSWRGVVAANVDEQALVGWRAEVVAFGDAVREQYVHQAHSFIEGGPGHLDHYDEAEDEARRRLDRLAGVPVRDADAALARIRADHEAFSAAFREEAMPLLREEVLDRTHATALHGRAQGLAQVVDHDVAEVLAALDVGQAAARDRAASAVTRAWWGSAALLVTGVVFVSLVSRRLAQAVLVPLAELREAVERFGDPAARGPPPVPAEEHDEIAVLASAFDGMAFRVAAAEERRVRFERLAALGEMSAAIAHELLNPLTVILGSTDDPVLRGEADHARKVVQGLLAFARPGEEPAGEVDLARVAHEAVARHGPLADAKGVALSPADRSSSAVIASESAVRQIVDNLLRNAIEAAPSGSTVEVVVAEGTLCVLDRGSGIPEAIRGRLYEPFVTARPGGTGLGLAVAARIARAHGGDLTHEDRWGGGTIATWRLGGRHA